MKSSFAFTENVKGLPDLISARDSTKLAERDGRTIWSTVSWRHVVPLDPAEREKVCFFGNKHQKFVQTSIWNFTIRSQSSTHLHFKQTRKQARYCRIMNRSYLMIQALPPFILNFLSHPMIMTTMRMSFPLLLHLPENPAHESLHCPSRFSRRLQLYPIVNPTFPYALQSWNIHFRESFVIVSAATDLRLDCPLTSQY